MIIAEDRKYYIVSFGNGCDDCLMMLTEGAEQNKLLQICPAPEIDKSNFYFFHNSILFYAYRLVRPVLRIYLLFFPLGLAQIMVKSDHIQ